MSTFTQIIYQIVFHTKHNGPTLDKANREKLFAYIAGVLANKRCMCYQVGGVENHIHIVTHLHPAVALADIIKDIKLSTTHYIKTNQLFPYFAGWQSGYGAFTYTLREKQRLINYVRNQEERHTTKSFLDEYKALLTYHGIPFDERYVP